MGGRSFNITSGAFIDTLQYITINTDQVQTGGKTARIRGNAKKKTMSGRSSDYQPLDVTIYGHFEVICSKMTDKIGMAGIPLIV